VFADFVKNPVSRPARTKYIPKEYLMYVAFSYSREGNTEMTPGMNLPKIQLADPDDEDELYRKVDELFKKVQFKFDAFEQKIIDLAWSEGLNAEPDQGVGLGQREMFWDFKGRTTEFSGLNKEMQQRRAKAILEFRAAVDKYVAAFNNTLIKIGLPGITNYSTWSGVLGDQLTDQQVRYFETPEGFANLASGKIDVAKMIDDNVAKQGVAEDAQWDTGDDVRYEEDDTTGTYYYKGWKFIETANDAYSGEAWLVEPDGDETWYGYEVDENHGIRKYYDKQGRHAFNLSAHDEGQSTEKWLKAHASDWGTTSLSQPKPYTMNEQGVAEGTSNITYKQQKGKNKFSIEMYVDGKSAGIFQYDAESGRTIVELDPAFRGQGLGQILILKGIYTAAMLGMNYVEDESRTQMFDRAMDRLVDAGYIVNDDEYWYVTSNGEQFLKQGVAEGTLR
jgi:GNAT superfamily N-acetyltransferase